MAVFDTEDGSPGKGAQFVDTTNTVLVLQRHAGATSASVCASRPRSPLGVTVSDTKEHRQHPDGQGSQVR